MSYALTIKDKLVARYPSNYDKLERRASKYGALELFQKQSNDPSAFLSAEAKALIEDSLGNAAEVNHPVIDAQSVSITKGSTITCSLPSDNEGTSKLIVTASPTKYSFGFTMVKDQFRHNHVGYIDALQAKITEFDLALAKQMDIDALAAISTAKNSYFPSEITAYYSVVGDALQVPQADKDDFYNQVSAIMGEMDFDGDNDMLINRIHQPMVNRYMAQGAANATNQAFQFDGYTWFTDNTSRLTNGVGKESTGYILQSGSLSTVTRIPSAYKLGDVIGGAENPVKEKTTFDMPISNVECALLYQKDCADKSGLGIGEARTDSFVEGWSFEVDVYYLSVYNSDTASRFTPIVKFEILS